MAHDRTRAFRPDDVGALQRRTHWALAAGGLLLFIGLGIPGLYWTHCLGLLALFARWDRGRGESIMDTRVRARDDSLAREWSGFVDADRRKAISLARRRPNRFLAGAVLVVSLILAMALGARVGDDVTASAVASRAGIAVAVCATLWFALFGLSRRTTLLFGSDGVRVGEAFVSYATMARVERQAARVVIERRSSSPAVVIETADSDTADRLVTVLTSEWERGRRQRAQPSPPLPTAGFRENASNVGWRVRVLDAPSREERNAAIGRVPLEDLRELLDETADPSLEEELRGRLLRK